MDDTYYLHYYHPNTFESEVLRQQGRTLKSCGCLFSAGYSAGWCSHAFNVEVHGREIRCLSRGDANCEFIMAPRRTTQSSRRTDAEREAGMIKAPEGIKLSDVAQKVFDILRKHTGFWPVLAAQCKRVGAEPETLGKASLPTLIPYLAGGWAASQVQKRSRGAQRTRSTSARAVSGKPSNQDNRTNS